MGESVQAYECIVIIPVRSWASPFFVSASPELEQSLDGGWCGDNGIDDTDLPQHPGVYKVVLDPIMHCYTEEGEAELDGWKVLSAELLFPIPDLSREVADANVGT